MYKNSLIFCFLLIANLICRAQPSAPKEKFSRPLLRLAKPGGTVDTQPITTDLPKVNGISEADLHMKFDVVDIEMKSVEEGNQAVAIYKFKNIGKEVIELQAVTPGCGCTASEYTKDPIKPGKTGTIKAVFNTTGRVGLNQKSIRVITKAGYSKTITFKCVVTKSNSPNIKPPVLNK